MNDNHPDDIPEDHWFIEHCTVLSKELMRLSVAEGRALTADNPAMENLTQRVAQLVIQSHAISLAHALASLPEAMREQMVAGMHTYFANDVDDYLDAVLSRESVN